jgi:hypothetical protein
MNSPSIYEQALQKLARRQLWPAELDARRLLSREDGIPYGWLVRAVRQSMSGDRTGAISAANTALSTSGFRGHPALEACTLLNRLAARDAAAEGYERILDGEPGNLPALVNLGNIRLGQGDPSKAADLQRRAVASSPGTPEAHYNLASALFHLDRIEEAFAEYEWRWKMAGFTSSLPDIAKPRWNGEANSGLHLHLVPEQGLGDCLHFIRFARLARERVGHLSVETPGPLISLFGDVDGIDEIVPYGSKRPDIDCWLPMLSLPHVLGLKRDAYPAAPYIGHHDRPVSHAGPPLRIGISWTGNPASKNNHLRTSTFEDFLPLIRLDGVRIVSLQKDVPADFFTAKGLGENIENPMPDVGDFADTAGIIAGLDLVVTVDNVIAHLAGAMGCPVQVMLPSLPDWRWGMTSSESFWYPSMRLYRENRQTGWEPAFRAMLEDVKSRLSGSS